MLEFNKDSYGIKSREAVPITSLVNPEFKHPYDFEPKESLENMDEIARLDCLLDVEKYLSRIAHYYGFNYYSDFTRVQTPHAPYKIYNVISEESKWTTHYRVNNFFLIDPSLRFIQFNSSPFAWDTFMFAKQLEQKLRNGETRVVTDALDYSMKQVVHIPFFNGNSECGLIRFIRFNLSPLDRKELLHFLKDSYLLCCSLFEKKIEILHRENSGEGDSAVRLSFREREVLTWYSSGASVSHISDTLTISENTVRNHLRNVRGKFGVRSTNQAIVKAINSNLIRL